MSAPAATSPPSTLEAALGYAKRGWPVLPVWWPKADGRCACGRDGCDRIAKHPVGSLVRHGLADATIDLERIRAWWGICPSANVGIRTGVASGLLVLDVDGEPGRASLARFEAAHGLLPISLDAVTGSGGRHIYFVHVNGLRNAVRFAPGLDARTEGGYVVAPPSLHASGNRYAWSHVIDDVTPAAAPGALIAMISKPEKRAASRAIVVAEAASYGGSKVRAL